MLPGTDGSPSIAWCLVPVSDVVVDHDSWNVSGLEGTGSKTVAIHDPVFVPSHRVLPLGRIFSGKVPGLEVQGNHQARLMPLAQGQLPEILKPPSTASTRWRFPSAG